MNFRFESTTYHKTIFLIFYHLIKLIGKLLKTAVLCRIDKNVLNNTIVHTPKILSAISEVEY